MTPVSVAHSETTIPTMLPTDAPINTARIAIQS